MEKKNPYKFTLGFDKTKPSHVRATEILNSVKDKADLIASALVSYIDDVRQEEGAVLSNEALQVLMQEMVKQEVAKAMHLHSIKPEEPNRNSNSVMAVQQESLETIAKNKLIEDGLHAGFCLCHGNMGNLLILKRYAEIFDDKQVRSICDSRFEQILEFLNEENILPTELYNPGFMTGLSGIAYALLKYKMPKLPLLIGVEGIYDRNEV